VSLIIPSVAKISKENPKLGEALLKIQQYANQNIAAVPGNRLGKPPVDATGGTAK
jgi:hypothetical protein